MRRTFLMAVVLVLSFSLLSAAAIGQRSFARELAQDAEACTPGTDPVTALLDLADDDPSEAPDIIRVLSIELPTIDDTNVLRVSEFCLPDTESVSLGWYQFAYHLQVLEGTLTLRITAIGDATAVPATEGGVLHYQAGAIVPNPTATPTAAAPWILELEAGDEVFLSNLEMEYTNASGANVRFRVSGVVPPSGGPTCTGRCWLP